ncbi:unnamed protein product, partial [Meganyctiphanes norvegica]
MARFGLSLVVVVFAVILLQTSASPVPQDQESGGWKTWHALKEVFAPVKNYFTDTFPKQTPQDIADNVKDTVSTAKHKDILRPLLQKKIGDMVDGCQILQETASDLGQMTFSQMYGDAKDTVQDIDQVVGDYIDEWSGPN